MQHVNHLLDEYYDGELSPTRRRQVAEHLELCVSCRSELEQMRRLSALIEEAPVPDVFSSAEIFGAQVALRVSHQRREHARYHGAAWHIVPVLLLCGVVVLRGLFTFLGGMTGVVRAAGRMGIDLGVAWPLWNAVEAELGGVLGLFSTSVLTAVIGAMMVVLYLATIAVFVPYVGWVRTLWRSSQDGLARKEV